MTNCINCGAPVDPAAVKCPYCDTPYDRPRKAAEAVSREVMAGILTPNEVRRRLGLREV